MGHLKFNELPSQSSTSTSKQYTQSQEWLVSLLDTSSWKMDLWIAVAMALPLSSLEGRQAMWSKSCKLCSDIIQVRHRWLEVALTSVLVMRQVWQVWLIPIVDERVGMQVKLWNPFRTRWWFTTKRRYIKCMDLLYGKAQYLVDDHMSKVLNLAQRYFVMVQMSHPHIRTGTTLSKDVSRCIMSPIAVKIKCH